MTYDFLTYFVHILGLSLKQFCNNNQQPYISAHYWKQNWNSFYKKSSRGFIIQNFAFDLSMSFSGIKLAWPYLQRLQMQTKGWCFFFTAISLNLIL